MFRHLDLESLPAAQRTTGTVAMRYEDIAQDGSIKLTAIAPAFGPACYRPLWRPHPINERMLRQGALAILTGMRIERLGGPVAVLESLKAEGGFALAHDVDEAGAVSRIFLNLQVNLFGPRGMTHGKQPPGAGERIAVGRAFAEHVFTRPFGPPAERKVLRLDSPEGALVPADRYAWPDAQRLLALAPDAQAVGDAATTTVTFGLLHTDSNQHVNSLVYPTLFEHAVLQHAHTLGVSLGLGHAIDIAYRRPCFAGDQVSLTVQLARDTAGVWFAHGYFAKGDDGPTRACCTLRLALHHGGQTPGK